MVRRKKQACAAIKNLKEWRTRNLNRQYEGLFFRQNLHKRTEENVEDNSASQQLLEVSSNPEANIPVVEATADEDLSEFEMTIEEDSSSSGRTAEGVSLSFDGLDQISLPLFITDLTFLLKTVENLLSHIRRCPRLICDTPVIRCASRNGKVHTSRYGNFIQIKMICSGCLDVFMLSNVPESDNSKLFGIKEKQSFPLDPKVIQPLDKEHNLHHNTGISLNSRIVWSSMASGIGQSQMNEFIAFIGLQPMMPSTYQKHQEEISCAFIKDMAGEMFANAMEEKRLAIAANQFDDGCPWISVMIDGGWCTRSYGHNFSSKSGCAVIIGSRTGKILYLGVKNKFCFSCLMEEKNGKDETSHLCFLNHSGTSSAMEARIITEGFLYYQQHNLRLLEIIGDDDSNVLHSIRENVSYGRRVTKLLCSNHVIRNFTKRLFTLNKSNNIRRSDKIILNNDAKKKMKSFARGSITICNQRKASPADLSKQFKAVPKHVLGDHSDCLVIFCNSVGEISPDEKYKELSFEAKKILGDFTSVLCEKVGHVMKDVTTNRAENLMSIICRMSMGKIANRSNSRYTSDVMISGLRQNFGPNWSAICYKKFHKESPRKPAKRLINRKSSERAKAAVYCTTKAAKERRYNSKRCLNFKESEAAYGPRSQKPDKSKEEFIREKERLFERLAVTRESAQILQEQTKGQANSKLWFLEKRDRLTASNFGVICRMKETTSGIPNITRILYRGSINSPAIEYGVINEAKARNEYERLTGCSVTPCGLFVDTKKPFLGASPDGLVGDNGLLEIKCPYTLRNHDPISPAPDSLLAKQCYKVVDVVARRIELKKQHHYYYQIQGQLNIAEREWCHFVVYSSHGIVWQKVERDKKFWDQEMLPKLERFYLEGILPEIIDSRKNRSMEIRELPHVVEMRKKKS